MMIETLMSLLMSYGSNKRPDFPTGGIILGHDGIKNMYRKGRGSIVIRARATIQQTETGRNYILVTEIPYVVNKSRLIEKMAELVRDKKIEGISDIRDESDRTGIRIVIEAKRCNPCCLNQLYKHTQMHTLALLLALVDNKPRGSLEI